MAAEESEAPASVTPLFDDERIRCDQRVRDNLLLQAESYAVSYEDCFAVQKDISHAMRGILLTWLRDVCAERQLVDDTYTLAVSLVDRHCVVTNIHRSFYQLVGGACLLVASKLRDPTPIETPEIVQYTERTVTREQLFHYERILVGSLQFDLESVTPWDLVCYVLRLFTVPGLDEDVDEHFRMSLRSSAKQFIYAVSSERLYLDFAAAVVAASAVIYALESAALEVDLDALTAIRDAFALEACGVLQVEFDEAIACLVKVSEAQRDTSNASLSELNSIDSLRPLSSERLNVTAMSTSIPADADASVISNSGLSVQSLSSPQSQSSPFTRATEARHVKFALDDVTVYEDNEVDAGSGELDGPSLCSEVDTPAKRTSIASVSSGYATFNDDEKENEPHFDCDAASTPR